MERPRPGRIAPGRDAARAAVRPDVRGRLRPRGRRARALPGRGPHPCRRCSASPSRAFSITWAWINFSWFASAYDTDDWIYRLTTMLQMVGVIILALGLPDVFESIDEGETVNNGVMVAGYVVMRVAMVFQWSRAARQNPERRAGVPDLHRRRSSIAQVGWLALLFAHTTVAETFVWAGAARS